MKSSRAALRILPPRRRGTEEEIVSEIGCSEPLWRIIRQETFVDAGENLKYNPTMTILIDYNLGSNMC